ncbi:MAG TPA: tyrosine--tRNA ligase [archaeon]|nr:tyrosine--tRNA ligase [archaeon]
MDIETKMTCVERVGEEIITREELRSLFETKTHPVAYDGFEPSGLAHLPFAVYRAINIEDMLKAGIHFKLWIADWFAWINNKMNGDLEKIRRTGEYFIEVWKAAGIDTKKIEFIWASESMDKEYWKRVIHIAKNTTVARTTRCLTIMGRHENEMKETAQYFYPMMQASDIFHLGADITQLGMDQRKVNMLAREVGPKLGLWKPIVVTHHTLMGLAGPQKPTGFDESKEKDIELSSKMSKSKPNTCIFVHDSKEEIAKKISSAYCPEKTAEHNPILDYNKHIIFRKFNEVKIERPKKFGGDISFASYNEMEKVFVDGSLHPADLKSSTAAHIDKLIKPIREHFEKGKAKELYEFVKKQEVTR